MVCLVNSQQAKAKYPRLETLLNNFIELKLVSSTGRTAALKLFIFGMYSQTSRKQPPNKLMQRLSGRLWESHILKRGLGTSTLWKIICCMQFIGYAMCNFRSLLKHMSYIPSSMVHTANIKIRECVKWSLTRG